MPAPSLTFPQLWVSSRQSRGDDRLERVLVWLLDILLVLGDPSAPLLPLLHVVRSFDSAEVSVHRPVLFVDSADLALPEPMVQRFESESLRGLRALLHDRLDPPDEDFVLFVDAFLPAYGLLHPVVAHLLAGRSCYYAIVI